MKFTVWHLALGCLVFLLVLSVRLREWTAVGVLALFLLGFTLVWLLAQLQGNEQG